MIKRVLTYYAERLEEFLASSHCQPEGLVTVGVIGTAAEETPNKMVISLINLEKEASGDAIYIQRSGKQYVGKAAPLLLNIHIIMAAVYEGRRYTESLSVLSDTLAFLQGRPRFDVDRCSYTIEVISTSTTDLHNIWTTMGGQYYPSVICKVRGLTVDSSAIVSSGSVAGQTEVKI